MFKKIFNTNIDQARISLVILITRVAFGAMMLTHGYPKFLKVLDGDFKFGDPLGVGPTTSLILAALGEFVGSIMVILGLGTRVGAFLLSATMATATFITHADDPFGRKEKALMYFIVFVAMMISGGGKYSLDRKLD
ncbi:MAG: DoxX family protein [Cyclobacteriaceae bacterium]